MQSQNIVKIGVIGGSGLYNIPDIDFIEELSVDTPYGATSDNLKLGRVGDSNVIFLARHGRNHNLSPSNVPYRANIWAMKSFGVEWIISASAVGSLQENIKPLDIVIPDQFIDRTKTRKSTFFDEGIVAHISMADPFCNELSNLIAEVAKSLIPKDRKLHKGGTYLCMEGPAFSTKAESLFYKTLGCSIIGMTNHTEAKLSREAEIAYSTIAMSTDFDCWHPDHDDVSVDMILENLKTNAELASKIIIESIKEVSIRSPRSIAHNSLKDSIVTPHQIVPKEIKDKLMIFCSKYW